MICFGGRGPNWKIVTFCILYPNPLTIDTEEMECLFHKCKVYKLQARRKNQAETRGKDKDQLDKEFELGMSQFEQILLEYVPNKCKS